MKTPKLSNFKTLKLIFLPFSLFAFQTSIQYVNNSELAKGVFTNSELQTPNSQLYFPHFFSEALDFSDLDVRDAFNRPIKSKEAKQQLAELFNFSVVNLLVSDALPVLASFRTFLEKLLAPLSEGFSCAKKWLMGKVFWALALAVKKISELFTLYSLPFTIILGDSNLRGASRQTFFPLTSYHLPLNLPLLC